MERFEMGMLAKSKAGHDKNQIYVILKEEIEYVYLANGENKTIHNPKRKNKKHVQVIKYIDQDIYDKLQNGMDIRNEDIKRLVKLYQAGN